MLGKVLKYEMRSLAKPFLPLFGGFLAVTLLCKLSFEAASANVVRADILDLVSVMFGVLYGIYVVALFVMSAVFIVTHFYRTMAGTRGYLSHTLPVKTGTLIHAKLLAALIWPVIACLVLAFSVVVFALGHVSFGELGMAAAEFFKIMGELLTELFTGPVSQLVNMPLLTVELILCVIAELLSFPLMVYASIAIGQLFLKRRVLWSVASYFGMYILLQIICTFFIGYIGHGNYASPEGNALFVNRFMFFMTAVKVLSVTAYYLITRYIFSKKLNLE